MLRFQAVLRLGLTSDGIAPLTESVSLSISDAAGSIFAAALPPGAFRREASGFIFADPTGLLANDLRIMRLRRRADGAVGVSATLRWPASSAAGERLVTLTVLAGNETGAVAIPLVVR